MPTIEHRLVLLYYNIEKLNRKLLNINNGKTNLLTLTAVIEQQCISMEISLAAHNMQMYGLYTDWGI